VESTDDKKADRLLNIPRWVHICHLARIVLCWTTILGSCGIAAWAYEVAPGIVIQQLTKDGKSYTQRGAGFAPKGDLIVFYKTISKSERQLWLIKADGSDARAISPVGWPVLAAWSPDGSKVGYVFANKNEDNSDACVCVFDVATGDMKRITGGYQRSDFGLGCSAPPIWAPDGLHLAYHVRDRQLKASFLVVFPADGAAPVRLAGNLGTTDAADTTGSWSPDGKQIVFVARPAKDQPTEIWRCNIDGTGLFQITNDKRDCKEPKWSPDGQWIVFYSAKDRYPDEVRMGWRWDILLVRPDGTDEHTIVSGRSQSVEGRGSFVHPAWAPDQSYIICVGVIEDAAGIGYNATFLIAWREGKWQRILGTPVGSRNLSEGHDWAISPDSRMVLRHGLTYVLRGTGKEAQETDPGDDLEVYEVAAGRVDKLLSFRQGKDAYYFFDHSESWAPDSERVLFCQGKVVSWQREQFEPDLYVLTIPEAGAAKVAVAAAASAPAETTTPPPTEKTPAPTETEALSAQVVRPKYLTVEQALATLPNNAKSYIQTEPERNVLIVNGPPEVAAQIREYLAMIDTPAPLVTLDVLVAEMSKTASRDLGLDWTYAKGRFGAELPIGLSGFGEIFYQGVGKLDRKFFAALSALEEKGHVTIRANPRLVSLSGKTATMNIRRTKYYRYTSGYDASGRAVTQQSDISADIIGKITPRVIGDGHILVDIEVAVGNFTFTANSSLPDVTTRSATASVVVNEGETVMISGLVIRQETGSVSKTPLLGDLPLLGQFFRSSHRRTEESVLTMFVTPYLGIMRGPPATLEEKGSMCLPAVGGADSSVVEKSLK
jgi:Tol biopolymer transport system component